MGEQRKDDLKTVLDFVLSYGLTNDLPNMDEGGSGDEAYEAAMRVSQNYQAMPDLWPVEKSDD